jgi:biotin transport system permease protein/energy-coupling factor transport system permease protein
MYYPAQYIPRSSPVHDRDPRVKIIVVVASSIIILHLGAAGLLIATGAALLISQLGQIPLVALLRTLRPVLPFFILLFLLYVFFTPGHTLPLFVFGPVQISYQGLCFGLLQVGKFLLLVLIASILTMTTTPGEITMGLERLLCPIGIIGISSHDIATMVSLALRFLPTLLEEMNRISEAQLARGANISQRHLSGKFRSVINLAIPLLLNIFRRCDELADAMEARGYQMGHRTYLRQLVLTRTDYLVIGATVMTLLGTMAWHP